MKFVNLHVYTWQGISIGATHCYGELQGGPDFGFKRFRLSQTISARRAASLNKRDPIRGNWKRGDSHPGFDSEDAAIKAALACWLQEFPGADYLIRGDAAYAAPKPVLAAAFGNCDELKARAGEIVTQCETLGWYDKRKNYPAMERLYEQWLGLFDLEQHHENRD